MDKIKTYQDFKKYTAKELMDYSNREDLTREESKLFIQFCRRALNDCNDDLIIQQDQTLEQGLKRKNNTNE